MSEFLEFDGKTFIHAEAATMPEWPCVKQEPIYPTLTLKDDDLFLITDSLGNILGCWPSDQPESSLGLFCRDTRFLSRLELQIDGKLPNLLSSNARRGFALSVLCANPYLEKTKIQAETIGIQREIVLNGGLFEELTLTNYSTHSVSFELSLSFDADFVDLFEIRGWERSQRGKLLRLKEQDPETDQESKELILAYQGLDNSLVESRIQFSYEQPDLSQGKTAIWQIELNSHQTIKLGYRIQLLMNSHPASKVGIPMTLMQAKSAEAMELQEWQHQVTQIRTDNKALNLAIEQAEQDIFLLRQSFGHGKVLSAGVPWFSTLFGRDSIIAAWQSLIFDPQIAKNTLMVLAEYQGKTYDEWREEEPGKILHEIRLGEMARCHEVPHTPYYGTIDATPLWLILYCQYYAWTGDQETIDKLWPNALAAMKWIDRNSEKTGYLSYIRHSAGGLTNQGWKDSGDCIVDSHGHLAKPPITLCEVQGYVYAAKMQMSELAKLMQHDDLSQQWLKQAQELKIRFNRDFWLPNLGFCALALDGDGKPVDSITSNPGHCLSLGIFELDKANSVAERLCGPDMFSGWGIRTLSSWSPAYNPMGYHIGSVWPHDNGIIALGLRSLGLIEQALEVAQGILDMTLEQPYQRPPELFCGYERTEENSPVRYPVACSPQAWATGTIFQLLEVMINIVPDVPNNCVRISDPFLPESINNLSLHNLRIGTTLLDLEFQRSGTTTACRVAKKRGNLRVVFEA
ncbi:Amylo-alpha-16-glucosidase [Gloeothece citriformis PCC 7424]|uniref:Amylo-alpha-16-glucosidase n=1 Tax=Gloeothece citriformis (strain PCC 7424) TaxID=65393 RepID=B7KKW8_GLOC7|nr:amylo-alpha-1,6-glucosidase [Gloeothece citriformis]ACK71087.1 Amylo-alpha-16-glucosidase [Gloeothece citriformis PCC 7424]